MNDLLYVSFDFDEEKKGAAICVGRPNPDGSHTILNTLVGDEAIVMYGCLTNRVKLALKPKKVNPRQPLPNLCKEKSNDES